MPLDSVVVVGGSLAGIRCAEALRRRGYAGRLVLVGEDDVLTPPDRAAEIAAAVPLARLVTVPRCGHLSTIEQPEAVTRALADLLNA